MGRDPPSRRIGNNFYMYNHDYENTRARQQSAIQDTHTHSCEVAEDRLRAGLSLRPEELRHEPVKKANERQLKALGFDGITLTQRRSSVLSRTSSRASSRASSKGGEKASSSKGEHTDDSSSSSDEDADMDSFAGSAQAASSSRSQSLPNSMPGSSSLQQECTRSNESKFARGRSDHVQLLQVQVMGHDDAEDGAEQHRARARCSSSTAAPSTSLSMHSVLTCLSRRFSSTELDKQAAQSHGRTQSCGSVSLDGSSQGLDLAGCLSSSADAYALLTKQLTTRASSGSLSSLDAGSAPGAPHTPFGRPNQQAPAARPAFSRRSVESVAVGGAGQCSSAEVLPSAFQLGRRSGGAAAVGGRGRSAGADACVPTGSLRSRRVSFVEGVPPTAAGSGAAAESQPRAVGPLRAWPSSTERVAGGTQAVQPASSFRPSSPRALQPTRRASASAATVAVPAAWAETKAVAAGALKQQGSPKRSQSASRLSFMAGSAGALRDLLAP